MNAPASSQSAASQPTVAGMAYVDGDYLPLADARISVLDWGFTRSDVTYDVVHVWKGRFFRLDDHVRRFQASVAGLRMTLPVDGEGLKAILMECVRRSGLRDSYVGMVCTRGNPLPGLPRHPQHCRNRLIAYAAPWVWVIPPEVQARGARLIIAKTPRIAAESVDPTIKNYHWGDLTRALFEASDAGADTAVLLDARGFLTEGPGFNIFAVRDGVVSTPDRGALEGITRQTVIELCAELGLTCEVRPMRAEDLLKADEVFCSTTAGGVMPVSRIDGHIMNNDSPGPLSTRLRDLYWRKHEEGWHATPVLYG